MAGGINTYGYVGGNPTGYTDVYGLNRGGNPNGRGASPYPRSRPGNPLGIPSIRPIGPRDPYRMRYPDPVPESIRGITPTPEFINPPVRPSTNRPGQCSNPGKRKFLSPIEEASGPHTVWKPSNGPITNHQTFNPNTNPRNPNNWTPGNRTDITGRQEFNKTTGEYVPTPHTHTNTAPGGIRPARPNEIPRR